MKTPYSTFYELFVAVGEDRLRVLARIDTPLAVGDHVHVLGDLCRNGFSVYVKANKITKEDPISNGC